MKPLLTYFDARGRAEPIRLMLSDLEVEFDERRITLEEWPALKSTFAFGQVPTYEDGEFFINQTHAICRHLARKYNLYGDNEAERIRCDVVEEAFVDAQNNVGGFGWNPKFAELREDYETTTLPPLLEKLQNLLDLNPSKSGWWVGDRVSYVDYLAWNTMDYVRALSPRNLARFDRLRAAKVKLESRPRVAEYLKSPRRPLTHTVKLASFGGTPETS